MARTRQDELDEQRRISAYSKALQSAIADALTTPANDQLRADHVHYLWFQALSDGMSIQQVAERYKEKPMLVRAALAGMLAQLVDLLARDYLA